MVTACCVNNTLYNKHKYQHKWLSLAVAQTVVDGHITEVQKWKQGKYTAGKNV